MAKEKMMKKLGLFLLVLLAAFPAKAEDYAQADWPNLVRTLVRFNALSLKDDAVVDEYAAITECDLYKAFYSDDFKWNKVRTAVRDSISEHIAAFPVVYAYKAELQLDRYDFSDKLYRFTPETNIKNINSFLLFRVEGPACGTDMVKYIPRVYRAVLDVPLNMEGLPLSPADAEGLLQQMTKDNNKTHIITAMFNLRIVYIDPLRQAQLRNENHILTQSSATEDHSMRLDARLDSVDFYEDEAMTRLVYRFQP